MYHRFVSTPTEDHLTELHRMTQQEVGRVAERARMVLLSADGFTVGRIIEVFGVTDDTVYKWLDRFEAEGPAGLHDRERSGRPPEIDGEALEELERVVERSPLDEGYEFTTWTTPLLRAHLEERMGIEVSDDTVRRTLGRLEFVWRRPRWHVGSEDPAYDERMGAIEAALDEARRSGDDGTSSVTVLFEDETDVRRLPPLRQMWMRRGEQARVPVPSGNAKFALYGVLDPLSGETFTAPYPKGRSDYTASFLNRLMERFEGEVVLVWDQASWHTSGAVRAVVASFDRLRVLLLPKRAPQENPVEDLWRALKRIVAANLERGLDVLREACAGFFDGLSNEDTLRLAGLTA